MQKFPDVLRNRLGPWNPFPEASYHRHVLQDGGQTSLKTFHVPGRIQQPVLSVDDKIGAL